LALLLLKLWLAQAFLLQLLGRWLRLTRNSAALHSLLLQFLRPPRFRCNGPGSLRRGYGARTYGTRRGKGPCRRSARLAGSGAEFLPPGSFRRRGSGLSLNAGTGLSMDAGAGFTG
jgi:hypothetical protein